MATAKQTAKSANPETRAERCKRTKPWLRSTGPRSPLGKRSTAQNARKHQPRDVPTVAALRADARTFEKLLRLHCRSPLLGAFEESRELRRQVIEQLVIRYRLLHGLSFDAALQRVRRLISAELRHLHRLPE